MAEDITEDIMGDIMATIMEDTMDIMGITMEIGDIGEIEAGEIGMAGITGGEVPSTQSLITTLITTMNPPILFIITIISPTPLPIIMNMGRLFTLEISM